MRTQCSLFTSFNIPSHSALGCWQMKTTSSLFYLFWKWFSTQRVTKSSQHIHKLLSSSEGKETQKPSGSSSCDSCVVFSDSVLKELRSHHFQVVTHRLKWGYWPFIIRAPSRATPLLSGGNQSLCSYVTSVFVVMMMMHHCRRVRWVSAG